MNKVVNKGKTSGYVYDISLDGTVVNALGINTLHNTDGFNFKLPDEGNYRYTEDNPYISTGLSRETEKDKKYVGFKADVAEFNDLFMKDFHYAPNAVNKMGLGIDEIVSSTCNLSRKNYFDYFPDNPFPEDIKMVGNSIKSKKMPEYIKTFIEKAVRLLARKQGKEFLEEYYAYIEKIYNYQIPLKQIASKGKIKKTLKEYTEDCKTVTKAGTSKSRQAWMELALKNNLEVNMGETLYYVNTGAKKGDADVKRERKYFYWVDGLLDKEKKYITEAKLKKEYKSWLEDNGGEKKKTVEGFLFADFMKKEHPEIEKEENIILNCELVPREIIESETDVFCEDGKEYNVPKYIEQFNKRITPLLVCFDKSIRNLIIISNPADRQYFTEEQCILSSGQPNKPTDQDTYEALMTMDDREIEFWMKHPEWDPPFLEECGMDWNKMVEDYKTRKENEKKMGIDKVREEYKQIISSLSDDEFSKIIEDGELPTAIAKLVSVDPNTGFLVAKEHPDVVIATIADIIDHITVENEINEAVSE